MNNNNQDSMNSSNNNNGFEGYNTNSNQSEHGGTGRPLCDYLQSYWTTQLSCIIFP